MVCLFYSFTPSPRPLISFPPPFFISLPPPLPPPLFSHIRAGHFFHIDFGFIMGADPKPFPPTMKLCKEMVEGMGGRKGSYYHEFRDFCCVVYNLLRRHGEIFIKMLLLMEPANMKDITMHNIEKVYIIHPLSLS